MSFTWVVQANLLRHSKEDVAVQLRELGIPFVGVNVIPFSDDLTFLFDEPESARVIPYGSAALMRRAMNRGWEGLFFDGERFRVDAWLQNRTDMLNDDAVCLPAGMALQWIRGQSFGDWHVRPVEDLKVFAGLVMRTNEIEDWLTRAEGPMQLTGEFSTETLIAISSAKTLKAEWRWFVVGGKIVDGSMYRFDGLPMRKHEDDASVIAEAQDFANDWLPHPTCCMDIALTEDGPRVIEFNCFNGCGFYDHDVAKIVREVTNYANAHSG